MTFLAEMIAAADRLIEARASSGLPTEEAQEIRRGLEELRDAPIERKAGTAARVLDLLDRADALWRATQAAQAGTPS